MRTRAILSLLTVVVAAPARDRIAFIEFFGYKNLDVEAIRRALPIHEGDPFTDVIEDQVHQAVHRVTGKNPTDVNPVCCVNDRDWTIYIGLPGDSFHTPAYHRKPVQNLHLTVDLSGLYEAMKQAEMAALSNGAAEEDGAPGYRLLKDAGARAAELRVREYALRHEDELIRVLRDSSFNDQRAMAADALGYAGRSTRQIDALEYAVQDSDATVRNNATRALGEILRAGVSTAAPVRISPFIEMLNSPTATDRNKSSLILWPLTESRDPQLLGRLHSEAGESLLEMARWRTNWNFIARVILARIAGVDESRVMGLASGPLPAFLEAIHHE
jgi:hypothetical protein